MYRLFTLLLIVLVFSACETNDYLLLSEAGDSYLNMEGNTVIGPENYYICYTDTFRNYAIVAKKGAGLVAINRKEEVLFNVFIYDNGPDPLSEGLFRIEKEGKIGYANQAGEIVITPKYTCAWPFEKGKAKVALNCTTNSDGEHSYWTSEAWFFINKNGETLNPD